MGTDDGAIGGSDVGAVSCFDVHGLFRDEDYGWAGKDKRSIINPHKYSCHQNTALMLQNLSVQKFNTAQNSFIFKVRFF